ncbi:MAG: lysophospholipid acyltransferase family protein [Actinomycetota bacterium]
MLYNLAYVVFIILFKLLYRFSVSGKENLLKTKPFIIAANHMSYVDPIVLGLAAYPRRIYFMAKEELFKIPILNWLIRELNAFPVRRGKSDKKAFQMALELLLRGKVVGLFPEGTRHRGKLGPAHSGVAILALKTGVPVIPIAIIGTDKILPEGKYIPRFPRIRAVIGKPIFANKGELKVKESILDMTDRIMSHIAGLMEGNLG